MVKPTTLRVNINLAAAADTGSPPLLIKPLKVVQLLLFEPRLTRTTFQWFAH
jgi:hypothetical protein